MYINKHLLFSIIGWLIIIIIYYNYVKKYLIKIAQKIAIWLQLSKKYTLQQATGIVELILIALSHGTFCCILVYLLGVNVGIDQFKLISPFFIFYGILLGIGEMGFSSLLCLICICILQKLFPKSVPQEAESWNTISKGGWIRHHIHTIRAFSPIVALPIILIQIGSEEIVFRGIIQNYFLNYGNALAALISLIFFVYMQIFLMPSGLAAMFPAVGALVMGAVHSYLYMKVPFLLPLIIAHMTFFIMSIYIR